MTGDLAAILVLGVAVYAVRLSGFLLAEATIPPAWERALGYVPVATLTAIVVGSLTARPAELPIRLIVAAVAIPLAWRTRRAWLVILVGLALYWLLRFGLPS